MGPPSALTRQRESSSSHINNKNQHNTVCVWVAGWLAGFGYHVLFAVSDVIIAKGTLGHVVVSVFCLPVMRAVVNKNISDTQIGK